MKRIALLWLFLGICLALTSAATQSSSPSSQSAPATTQAKAPAPAGSQPSASEIAAAKASHKVWVNLNTGLYHKRGRWYGKTKDGKFMTEDEARKAGYKRAKRD